MELETMFVEQRWNIIEQLSKEKQSPLQLSQKLNTTMANISQQLKLLEASKLVQKQKIKNRDKGKPRTLFSLTDDHAYVVSAMQKFAGKRLLKMDSRMKAIVRIWFLESLNYEVEKMFWAMEPYLQDISFIAVNEPTKKVFIVSEKTQIALPKSTLTLFLSSKMPLEKSLSVIYDARNGGGIQAQT